MPGPNGELNGTSIVLWAAISPGVYQMIGSQRGVKFTEKSAYLDFSSKANRAKFGDYGRYEASAQLTHLYVPTDSGMAALRNATRNGTSIIVQKYESGSKVEQATCIVTQFDLDAPDQAPAVVTTSIDVSGTWA